MKKGISFGLLGGVSALVFIIIFTNIFGVDPSTAYNNLTEGTIFRKYYLDIILAGFVILAIILNYKGSKQK